MIPEWVRARVAGRSDRRVRPDGGSSVSGEASDRTGVSLTEAYDPDLDRLDAVYDEPAHRSVGDRHLAGEPPDPAAAADLVPSYREAGIGAAAFVDSHRVAVEALVAAAFEQVREATDGADGTLDRIERELAGALGETLGSVERGVETYTTAEREHDGVETGAAFDADALLDRLGTPLFAVDADGGITAWNRAMEELTQVERAEAREMEMASQAFYPDGRRADTLADKVLEHPETADEVYGVDPVADVGFTVYEDTSTMTTVDGTEREIRFRAAPLYDDGELAGAVEIVDDETEAARRRQANVAVVEELETTMEALKAGRLDARADPEATDDADDLLLEVVADVNELAAGFETAARDVGEQAGELASSIDEAGVAASRVEQRVSKQTDLLAEATDEIQGVSASMEEIAATSDQVATAAQQALDSADEGLAASAEVQEATDGLTEMGEELVESVSELETRIGDIEEIVEVISEVAEQTNLLALNANIEAARAGEAGAGFSVVADEVKSLAEETSGYTEEISRNIEAIQAQASETVAAVDDSQTQIRAAERRVNEALGALEEIADAVEEAADGITEVAEANDGQAATVEEITTTIEEVHDQAEAAEAATEDIVSATQRQTQAVNELYSSVDELVER
jgi:methyl-accepting chemotaxis protein